VRIFSLQCPNAVTDFAFYKGKIGQCPFILNRVQDCGDCYLNNFYVFGDTIDEMDIRPCICWPDSHGEVPPCKALELDCSLMVSLNIKRVHLESHLA